MEEGQQNGFEIRNLMMMMMMMVFLVFFIKCMAVIKTETRGVSSQRSKK